MTESQKDGSSADGPSGLSRGQHATHGILSFLTVGAWLPVWGLHWLCRRFGGKPVGLTLGALFLLATAGLGYVRYQWYESLPEEEKARMAAERVARRVAAEQGEVAEARRTLCKDRAIEAFTMSQSFVERQLRSPSTAKFPWFSDPAVRVRPADECSYQVVAYVDSQNGFGATVRTPYYALVSPGHDGKKWVLNSLTVE